MKKVWLNSYPETMQKNLANTEHSDSDTILTLLGDACAKYSTNTAFSNSDGSKSLSYAELEQFSLDFSKYLLSEFITGDAIALCMPNILAYPVAVYGALRAGLRVVNVNPNFSTTEMIQQLNDSEAKCIVVFDEAIEVAEQVMPKTSLQKMVTVGHDLQKETDIKALDICCSFGDAMRLARKMEVEEPAISSNDIAFLQYTGGTTGIPKAAMLTHRNIIGGIKQYAMYSDGEYTPTSEIVLTIPPLYHAFALVINFLFFSSIGSTIVLIANPRDPKQIEKAFRHWPITVMTGVNTLYASLLSMPWIQEIDFAPLKKCITGAAPTNPDIAAQWLALTACRLLEGYGSTETSAIALASGPDIYRSGAVGLPLPGLDISVRDVNGNELPMDTPGELHVKGNQIMLGYWKNPEETRKTIGPDNFLATGDIVTVDRNGFVTIIDRLKDVINVSGFNVYPNEIETAVEKHSDVLECVCVGVADARTGEAVAVTIVSKSEISKDDLRLHCRKYLAAYKIPTYLSRVDELPKSPVGKILRWKVRDTMSNG